MKQSQTAPTGVTEHLSRYMEVLRTRGSSVHSIQEGIRQIDFDAEQPHRHDFYQLLWFERGVGRYQVDFVERDLEDHSLHFVTPGHVHWYQIDPACAGLVIVLSEQFFLTNEDNRQLLRSLALFVNNLYFQPLAIGREEVTRFSALAQQILAAKQTKAPFKSEIIRTHIQLFLLYALRAIASQHQPQVIRGPQLRQTQLVLAFWDLVEQHFTRLHSVAEYAAELAITPNYLNEIVKEQTARNAGAIIQARLVLEAKRLAYFTELTSQEIATRLGFADPAYFSRFFKQQSGQTLSQFRATIRKKYNLDRS
jgi:AraC family transcriptional regulator, transcriptional activator of pobA